MKEMHRKADLPKRLKVLVFKSVNLKFYTWKSAQLPLTFTSFEWNIGDSVEIKQPCFNSIDPTPAPAIKTVRGQELRR